MVTSTSRNTPATWSTRSARRLALFTVVAGVLGGGTAAKPTGNIGQKGYTGDGAQGNVAAVNAARGVGVDSAGNIYIADSSNNVVRKITASTGVISTVVGAYPGSNTNAVAGFGGDGGPAASAATLLNVPEDVEIDALGNMFVADMGNARVRVVYAGGTVVANLIQKTYGSAPVVGNIYTIVGNGSSTANTNPGPVLANTVSIGSPRKLRLDAQDNIYLADNGNNVIWFVDAATGYMRVVAGQIGVTSGGTLCSAHTDAFGDNCPATQATLNGNSAMGVAVDTLENIYISDSGDARLRKVVTDQVFAATPAGSTLTQTLEVHFTANDGPAANGFVLTGSSDFKIANSACTPNPDATQDCLLTVNFTPSVAGPDAATLTVNSSMNGSATFGLSGVGSAASVAFDPGTTASFATALKTPQGLAQDAAGNTYIADTGNNRVLKFAAAGTPTVVAGTGTSGYTGDNGAATSATLNAPKAVAVTRTGLIYIADSGNNVVRLVNPTSGSITTVAGAGTSVCSLSVDSLGDGCLGTSATFKAPAGLTADPDGNIYISDSGNNVIRELTVSGFVFSFAGGASAVCASGDVFGNGCAANGAQFLNPTGLQMDSNRNLYIADTGDNEVREVLSSSGTVKVIAGTGQAGASGNGGTATGAQLSGPTGVAVDAAGGVYIADTGNSAIRLVNAAGTINTTVGTLSANGTGTLPGSAFAVQLASPSAVASNGAGTLVVLDAGNGRAFTDARGSVSYNFGRTNLGATSPTLQIQETSTGSVAATLSATGSPLFSPVPASPFALAGSGSSGCAANATLAPGSSCLLTASFSPSTTQAGSFSATYTESTTNTINAPTPFITLSGTGAVLTSTTSTTVVTTPATGSPQYSVPFTVTTTVTPSTCNTAAPSCFPTGTVTFYVGGNAVGLPVTVAANGTASQSISGLNVGSYNVTAVYSGDTFYASSSATALVVAIARGATTTTVTLSPASGPQFSAFNISAKVTSSTSNIPTGSFTFFAGTTQIGTAAVDARTGTATLLDTLAPVAALTPSHYQNYGLNAGTYNITAVYSGDTNYAPSTSAAAPLNITADAATFTVSLNTNSVGTAQGSTSTVIPTIIANNTLSGTITFACTNLPANSTCTFGPPTSLTFAAVPGVPAEQQSAITIWTDVPPGVIPTTSSRSIAPRLPFRGSGDVSLAALLGWPVLLSSFAGILAFRKRLRQSPRALRLFSLLALFGVLAGGSAVLSGCSSSSVKSALTPVGTYTINFVATGPGSTSVTTPITFTVGAGALGQF